MSEQWTWLSYYLVTNEIIKWRPYGLFNQLIAPCVSTVKRQEKSFSTAFLLPYFFFLSFFRFTACPIFHNFFLVIISFPPSLLPCMPGLTFPLPPPLPPPPSFARFLFRVINFAPFIFPFSSLLQRRSDVIWMEPKWDIGRVSSDDKNHVCTR